MGSKENVEKKKRKKREIPSFNVSLLFERAAPSTKKKTLPERERIHTYTYAYAREN